MLIGATVDSQSAKMTDHVEVRGYEGGKYKPPSRRLLFIRESNNLYFSIKIRIKYLLANFDHH